MAVSLVMFAPWTVSADTIYLKNGHTIAASNVTQENGQVSGDTAEGRLSFPASIVDHVARDSAANTVHQRPDRAANLPIAPPNLESLSESDETGRAAVKDGAINVDLLTKLESEADANPSPSAVARVVAAEMAAAQFEISVGDYDRAMRHYDVGFRYAPDNADLLLQAAYLHLQKSEYSPALDLLNRARRTQPFSPDVAKLTGWAYYGLNRVDDAVTEWKRALALRPDAEVQHALEKAERDAQQEATFHEGQTPHFVLRYDGAAAPELASKVLETLEGQFTEISAALDYVPPEPIGVILYTNKAFMDITRAPGWVGALNDGRMRIPIEGLSSMTGELARVLKHELTHSFITQKTGGRCPVWLQEGIAQYMEGKRSGSSAARLAADYQQHLEFSLASYEASWMNLSSDDAFRAYAWSLAVVETIVNQNGMSDLERILDRIAAQSATEDAVRAVLHDSYTELTQASVEYLRKTYL